MQQEKCPHGRGFFHPLRKLFHRTWFETVRLGAVPLLIDTLIDIFHHHHGIPRPGCASFRRPRAGTAPRAEFAAGYVRRFGKNCTDITLAPSFSNAAPVR